MLFCNQKLQIFTVFVLILTIAIDLFFPKIGSANSQIPIIVNLNQQNEKNVVFIEERRLPKNEDAKPKKVIYVTVTAYSSDIYQCDNTPFITASGTYVRDGIVAANFLKFGTKVRLPDYSGNKIYTVEDRMNARYPYRVDIWMPTKKQAKEFGIKKLKMEIY